MDTKRHLRRSCRQRGDWMKHEADLWALVIRALLLEKHEYEYGRKQKLKSRVRSVCIVW
jgi:hypothetical protein